MINFTYKKRIKRFLKKAVTSFFIFSVIISYTYGLIPGLQSISPKVEIAYAAPVTIILNFNQTILTEGTTWTVPDDWTDGDNTIEVIGGGGAGYSDTANTAGAAGGGGGGYSKSVNIDLTPGGTVTYAIGLGGKIGAGNGGET